MDQRTSAELEGPILRALRAHPQGISEFDLIRVLQRDRDVEAFADDSLGDPVSLYRTHFLLFHSLYRLDEALPDARVEVSCLCCRLLPRSGERDSRPAAPDPMRSFYRDLDNLAGVDREHVEALLAEFWRRYVTDTRRAGALAVLDLCDPVSDAAIKASYRRLAMRHHPDRGGETARLQEINEAARVLGLRVS